MILVIQDLIKEYEEQARDIILKGLAERFGLLDDQYNHDLNNLMESYILNGEIFLIGIIDGEVSSTGALTTVTEEIARIERMSVKKKYRGRGFAKQILEKLEQRARDKGYNQIVLETNTDWISAVGLYDSCGYRVSKTENDCTYFVKKI